MPLIAELWGWRQAVFFWGGVFGCLGAQAYVSPKGAKKSVIKNPLLGDDLGDLVDSGGGKDQPLLLIRLKKKTGFQCFFLGGFLGPLFLGS